MVKLKVEYPEGPTFLGLEYQPHRNTWFALLGDVKPDVLDWIVARGEGPDPQSAMDDALLEFTCKAIEKEARKRWAQKLTTLPAATDGSALDLF